MRRGGASFGVACSVATGRARRKGGGRAAGARAAGQASTVLGSAIARSARDSLRAPEVPAAILAAAAEHSRRARKSTCPQSPNPLPSKSAAPANTLPSNAPPPSVPLRQIRARKSSPQQCAATSSSDARIFSWVMSALSWVDVMAASGMEDEIVSGEVREQEDDDDNVPQLSAAAMEALREFLAGQHRPEEQNEAGGGEDGVELVPEDWRLSQFWYDEHTARELVEEVVRLVSPSRSGSAAGAVACIACPTLYAYLKKTVPGVPAQLLEYEERFGQYGGDFTFYDYNRPEELPAAMKHAYRVIVADPPYLSKECLEKVAKTVSFLARPEGSFLLLLTEEEMAVTITWVKARQIFISRDNPTVEVDVGLSDGSYARGPYPAAHPLATDGGLFSLLLINSKLASLIYEMVGLSPSDEQQISAIHDVQGRNGVLVDEDWSPIHNLNFRLKCCIVYGASGARSLVLQHRYYRESMPFGSKAKAYIDSKSLAYLTAKQALADFAVQLTDLKRNLSAEGSPVVLFGDSYGGMLAAWIRLKYPHIAIGALASSAPILQFEDIVPSTIFYDLVSDDFRRESLSCFLKIKDSWKELDDQANKQDGLLKLSKTFHLCQTLKTSGDLSDWLSSAYSYLAMKKDGPSAGSSHITGVWGKKNRLSEVCRNIDSQPKGTGTLERICA
uniref:Protein-lysine N-methyltransferase n=1 Tax=Zea mays TaxID=4577 RepID=A0A804NEQ0_MAIZE